MSLRVTGGNGLCRVQWVRGKPPVVLNGPVPVRSTFKGKSGIVKIKGKRETVTPAGEALTAIISGLQKGIRRGDVELSCYCLIECFKMGGPFLNHAKNRLRMSISEDIGLGNSKAAIMGIKILKSSLLRDLCDFVNYLCRCVKSRDNDCLLNMYVGNDADKEVGRLKPSADYSDLSTRLEKLKRALDLRLEEDSCFWALELLFRESPQGKKIWPTSRGKSKDPIYGVWDELRTRASNMGCMSLKIVDSLLRLFDLKKNGRSESMFLLHAVRYILLGEEDNQCESVEFEDSKINNVQWGVIQKHEVRAMPSWVYDKHVIGGNPSVEYFWDVGAKLNGEVLSSKFASRAKSMAVYKQRKGIKGIRRMKRKRKILGKRTGGKVERLRKKHKK